MTSLPNKEAQVASALDAEALVKGARGASALVTTTSSSQPAVQIKADLKAAITNPLDNENENKKRIKILSSLDEEIFYGNPETGETKLFNELSEEERNSYYPYDKSESDRFAIKLAPLTMHKPKNIFMYGTEIKPEEVLKLSRFKVLYVSLPKYLEKLENKLRTTNNNTDKKFLIEEHQRIINKFNEISSNEIIKKIFQNA